MQFISHSEIYGCVSALGLGEGERGRDLDRGWKERRERERRRGDGVQGRDDVLMAESCCTLDKYGPSLAGDET